MSVIRVDGPARLYIGDMACGAPASGEANTWSMSSSWDPNPGTNHTAHFSELGVTENGVQISINNAMHRVNSDDCGGSEGMPAEFLMMNTNAVIRGVLVRYAETLTALGQAFSGCFNSEEGKTFLPGTPYFASGNGFSLLIIGFAARWYFPKCEMATQPREFNISSTERKTSFSINAYPVFNAVSGLSPDGTLYIKHSTGGGAMVPECAPSAYGGEKAVPSGVST